MAVKLGEPVEKSYGREDINDRYHRYEKILGRGAYKTVYWGWDSLDGVDVAWNCIDLDALPSTEERRKISREVEMLQQLNHKHILRIRNHWENPQTNQLCFITDILQGGSLREYIRQREVNLGRCKSWCIQILDALHYLHSSSPVIIHRDLKCDNIFIDGPSGNITIGDLGLSTQYGKSSNILSTTHKSTKGMSIVGTPEFMAPEFYGTDTHYDEKVDIYAFGMCVLEMISKKYPYEECANQIQVIRKVTEKKKPDILCKLHRYVRTFIEICIERDPKKRPSANELLKHPFLIYMDDLKNKLPVSYFVGENRIIQTYKLMEEKEKQKEKEKEKQLSTIIETIQPSTSPSPQNRPQNNIIIINNNNNNNNNNKNKIKKKKKYISGTSVNIDKDGKISVKLKIHHDKESQKVKFQYDPITENISSVVREMVETLELDQSRENEIVNAIKIKLNNLDLESTTTESNNISPKLLPYPILNTHTQTSPIRYPQRASTQPPTNITLKTNIKQSYSEPSSANNNTENNNNKPSPFYESLPPPPQTHLPKVFNPNGTKNIIHHTQISNKSNKLNKSLPLSAPVTPGHSPPTEKNNINNNINTQPKYDSLLDQIMALPRETIEARIKQFGGSVNNDDETRILVTKLFQLLSGHSNHKKSQPIELQSIEAQPIEVEIENNTSLIMHHVGSHANLQHLNVNNVNNVGNLNIVKSSYNSEIVSSAQSIHNTPPKMEQRLIQPQISSNITSISPQNELVYQQRQISQESIKSNLSYHSHHSFTSHSHSNSHSHSHSHSPKSLSIISNNNNNNNNNNKSIDPNIELPKLRLRQKELMKAKICAEMTRLKQRTDTQVGKDKTIDDIALELEEVDKQIKLLADVKNKKIIKTINNNKIINKNNIINNSRPSSITVEPEQEDAELDNNKINNHISSPLVSNSHRDEFDNYVKQLPQILDLSEIGKCIEQMKNIQNIKTIAFDTWNNANNRIIRERIQLEEEYKQYYADQTEMLLLKLQKHKNNQNKCISETHSTANKLKYKQDKQRNKYKSIVDDQLQILQLTLELNENDDIINNNIIINDDELYLYKEEMDKIYATRVKQFETKQKKELESFRNDLHQLKQLKLEIKKTTLVGNSTHSSPKHQSQNHRQSPAIKSINNSINNSIHNSIHNSIDEPYNINGSNINGNNINTNVIPPRRNLHQHSSSSGAVQLDLITGPVDEPIIDDTLCFNNNSRQKHTTLHYHSSSLPLLDNNAININKGSKFKVSEVNYNNYNNNLYSQINNNTYTHNTPNQSLNDSFNDINNIHNQ